MVHQPFEEVFRRIRVLFDAGIKIAIGSDDPAFMENAWLLENLLLVKRFCKFTNSDILKLTEDAIQMSWAPDHVKTEIMKELHGIALAQNA
jgi:adenosine deaminase